MLCDEFARERGKRRWILRCGTVPADPNGSFFSRFETVAIQTDETTTDADVVVLRTKDAFASSKTHEERG